MRTLLDWVGLAVIKKSQCMPSQCTVHRNKNAGGWMSVCVFKEQLDGHSSLTHSLTHSTTIPLSLSLGYLFVHKHNNARFGGWNWYLVFNSLLILSLFVEEGSNCLEDDSIARCEWKGWTGLNGATRQGLFSPTTTRLLSGVKGNSTRRIQKKQAQENKRGWTRSSHPMKNGALFCQ